MYCLYDCLNPTPPAWCLLISFIKILFNLNPARSHKNMFLFRSGRVSINLCKFNFSDTSVYNASSDVIIFWLLLHSRRKKIPWNRVATKLVLKFIFCCVKIRTTTLLMAACRMNDIDLSLSIVRRCWWWWCWSWWW